MLVMLLLLVVSGVVSGPGPNTEEPTASPGPLTRAPAPPTRPTPAEVPVNDAPAPPAASASPQQARAADQDADDEDVVDDTEPDQDAALASQSDLLGLSGTLGGPLGTKERLELVRKLLKQEPLIDGHNDLPWNIRKFVHNRLARLQLEDLRQGPGPWSRSKWSQTDLSRLRTGSVGGQVRAYHTEGETTLKFLYTS
ncbi:Putative dipeptidase [Frankliniella fusca]|uniref:Dipeptidase n=1 Tax=Frankliniella fusca TaxID=407009 RepID=A0AAE1L6F5_9NEOP|nr:Putative dipeptidase [Frankliniella fusca]